MDKNYTVTAPALTDTDAAINDAQPLLFKDEEVNIKHLKSEVVINKKKKKKHEKKEQGCCDHIKTIGFGFIGFLTLVYSLGELGVAIWLKSLALLSDGFHNLSDVVSLMIAIWANQVAKKVNTEKYSYGWGRAEILGALTNACFLLSLSLYIVLEAIPKIIEPEPIESGLYFIIVASAGIGLNLLGTIVFAVTGQNSHGHSHAGGGHGHAHGGHGEKKEKKEKHHDHEHGEKKEKKDKEKHHDHEHGEKKEKKDKEKHHDHEHGEKKEKKEKHHDHEHGEKDHDHDHSDHEDHDDHKKKRVL